MDNEWNGNVVGTKGEGKQTRQQSSGKRAVLQCLCSADCDCLEWSARLGVSARDILLLVCFPSHTWMLVSSP